MAPVTVTVDVPETQKAAGEAFAVPDTGEPEQAAPGFTVTVVVA